MFLIVSSQLIHKLTRPQGKQNRDHEPNTIRSNSKPNPTPNLTLTVGIDLTWRQVDFKSATFPIYIVKTIYIYDIFRRFQFFIAAARCVAWCVGLSATRRSTPL